MLRANNFLRISQYCIMFCTIQGHKFSIFSLLSLGLFEFLGLIDSLGLIESIVLFNLYQILAYLVLL